MAKWADYLVSAVKRQTNENKIKVVSHVLLHEDGDTHFTKGELKTKDEAILLLKKGFKIKTISWDYEKIEWTVGADIFFETIDEIEYLQTKPDGAKKNNINHLIAYTQ